jgi:osmotically inducible lipoprotein OsmB
MKIPHTLMLVASLSAAGLLAGCGTNMEQRAATGAATGLVVAGPVGAAVGAAVGAVVDTVDKADDKGKGKH